MTQDVALWITFAGVAALGGLCLWIAAGARERRDSSSFAAGAGRMRVRLFAALAVAFVPITAWSLTKLPYGAPGAGPGAVVVDVVGHQWYWEIARTELPVGTPVVFRVTSADVNHGFAVYDPHLHLVAQTQAMPGYVNQLAVVFEEPGEYRVLCLEYCGAVHHGMAASLHALEEVR